MAGCDNSGKLSSIWSFVIVISGNDGNCGVRSVSVSRRGCKSISIRGGLVGSKLFPPSKSSSSSLSLGSMYVNAGILLG